MARTPFELEILCFYCHEQEDHPCIEPGRPRADVPSAVTKLIRDGLLQEYVETECPEPPPAPRFGITELGRAHVFFLCQIPPPEEATRRVFRMVTMEVSEFVP